MLYFNDILNCNVVNTRGSVPYYIVYISGYGPPSGYSPPSGVRIKINGTMRHKEQSCRGTDFRFVVNVSKYLID